MSIKITLFRLLAVLFVHIISCGSHGLALGQEGTAPAPDAKAHVFREVETRLELVPDTRKIRVIIDNRASEVRYLVSPLDLTVYRIKLTTAGGQLVPMTAAGVKKLTEFAAGSVNTSFLRTNVPESSEIDLAPLFQFPESGEVRCEVTRLVHFSDPDRPPSDKGWLSFPAILLPSGQLAPDQPKPSGPSSVPPQPSLGEDSASTDPAPADSAVPGKAGPSVTPPSTSAQTAAPSPWAWAATGVILLFAVVLIASLRKGAQR